MTNQNESIISIPYLTVPNPEQWALGEEPAYVVVTGKNWPAYYSKPPGGSDFSTCIYFIASPGMKPNPGYSIRFLRFEQLKDTVTIKVELKEPDPGKFYIQIIVRLISVAKVVKTHLGEFNPMTFVFIDQKGRQLATLMVEL